MAENIKVICDKEDIVAIADATREATGSSSQMTLRQIANEVSGLSRGVSDEAINEHNISRTAHADIRQQISQLSSEKVNQEQVDISIEDAIADLKAQGVQQVPLVCK